MKYLLYVLLFLNTAWIHAHSIDSLHFSNYSIADGLADSTITDIAQDDDNFLWLLTEEGLYRFDGQHFMSIGSQFGIPENLVISSLQSDSAGNIWVLGQKQVFLLEPGKQVFRRFISFPEPKKAYSLPFSNMFETSTQTLLINLGNQLLTIDIATLTADFVDLELKTITTMSEYQGNILLGCEEGLYYFASKVLSKQISQNTEIVPLRVEKSALNRNLDFTVTSLAVLDEKLYVGTQNNGVFELDKNLSQTRFLNTQSPSKLSSNKVKDISVIDEQLWIGYYSDGIDVIVNEQVVKRLKFDNSDPHSIQSNTINIIFKSHNNDVWIGTNRGGLAHYRDYTKNIYHLKHSLKATSPISGNDVTAIAVDKYNRGWLAAYSDGISVYNPDIRKSILINPELAGIKVIDMVIDNQHAWVLNENGISKINVDSLKVEKTFTVNNSSLVANDTVKWIELGNNKALISHQNYGISIFDKSTQTFSNYQTTNAPLQTNNFFTAYRQERFVWIASTMGIHAYDSIKHAFTYYPYSQGDVFNKVNHITENSEGNLILSTNQGVYQFNPLNKVTTNIGVPETIQTTNIQATLVTGDGTYWSTTKQGLFRYRLHLDKVTWFTEEDGLQGNYFNQGVAYLNSRGAYVFSGLNGISVLYPKEYDKPDANIVLSKLFITFKDGTEKTFIRNNFDNIEFEKPINSIEFTFGDTAFINNTNTSISLDNNGAINRLDGFSITLTPKAGLNTIAFFNDGGYDNTFANGKTFTFTNPYPFYSDTGFLIAVFLLVLLLLSLVYKLNTKSIQGKKNALEEVVKQRTAELHRQNQLAQEQANKLSHTIKEKNSIFETVSHELRTPLTLILGPINQLSQSDVSPEELQQNLKIVARNAKKLNFLVNKIFELSLSTQLGYRGKEDTFSDLSFAINSQMETFIPFAQNKNITLTGPQFETLEVKASLYEIQSIISNLLLNALQYTPKNGRIDLSVEVDSYLIKLHIRDTGIGIEHANINKIFDRFYRSEQAQNMFKDGAGLGLFMVSEMLKKIDADISVVSSPGEGSCFTLSFPNLKKQHLIPITHDQNDKPKVLVIDDNPEILTYIELVMKKSFQVTLLSSPTDAILTAQELDPDLIITDIMMPEIDGITLTKNFKKEPLLSHIPIILLSAKTDHEDIVEGLKLETADYIRKPFNNEELRLKALNIISSRKQRLASKQKALSSPELVDEKEVETSDFISRLCDILEENYMNADYSVKELSECVGIGDRQLLRRLKSEIGLSPNEFLRNFRLRKAAILLKEDKSISYVAYDTGFTSPSYFSTCFKKLYGETPKQYVQKQSKAIN